jgi:hypothetical protein
MKKLFLTLFLLLTSCYKGYETDPNRPEEYIGHWLNKFTFVNDTIDYNNIVFHYTFGIMQSEVILYESSKKIKEYQNWKVNKIDSTLYLINTEDSIFFKILKEPYINGYTTDMILGKNNIIYYLSKQ